MVAPAWGERPLFQAAVFDPCFDGGVLIRIQATWFIGIGNGVTRASGTVRHISAFDYVEDALVFFYARAIDGGLELRGGIIRGRPTA